MVFPLCFSSCLYAHSVENTLLVEEGTRGTLTAKIPGVLGLEMHLVVGLLEGVLLKYFNSFGFIKNRTSKTHYFFEYKEYGLSTTTGLIWEKGGLALKKVVGEQLFYSGQHRMNLQYCKILFHHQLMYSWRNLVFWDLIQTPGSLISEKKDAQ